MASRLLLPCSTAPENGIFCAAQPHEPGPAAATGLVTPVSQDDWRHGVDHVARAAVAATRPPCSDRDTSPVAATQPPSPLHCPHLGDSPSQRHGPCCFEINPTCWPFGYSSEQPNGYYWLAHWVLSSKIGFYAVSPFSPSSVPSLFSSHPASSSVNRALAESTTIVGTPGSKDRKSYPTRQQYRFYCLVGQHFGRHS